MTSINKASCLLLKSKTVMVIKTASDKIPNQGVLHFGWSFINMGGNCLLAAAAICHFSFYSLQ